MPTDPTPPTPPPVDLDALGAIVAKAWRGPWSARTFEIDCPCPNGDDCGNPHTCEEVEALEEYPSPPGQCVVQISVPGLEQFASANAAAIVALRNAWPSIEAEMRAMREVAEALRKHRLSYAVNDVAWYAYKADDASSVRAAHEASAHVDDTRCAVWDALGRLDSMKGGSR